MSAPAAAPAAPVVERFGDLLDVRLVGDDGRPVAFGHGNNLNGGMVGGIAATLAAEFPGLREAYDKALAAGLALGDVHVWQSPVDGRWILNLATQVTPGPDARLDAVEEAVAVALRWCAEHGIGTLALPRIGAGIGGLAWDAVLGALGRAVAEADVDVALVVVTRPADLSRPPRLWNPPGHHDDPLLSACETAICGCGHEVLDHDLVCEVDGVDCACDRSQVAALLASGVVEVTVL